MSLLKDFETYKRNLARNLNRATMVAEGEAHRLVAQKTGDLDASIKTDQPRIEGNLIKNSFGSELGYAIFVHEGVRNKVYNYHRGTPPSRQVVYSGVGQKFLDRAIIRKEGDIVDILRSTRIK